MQIVTSPVNAGGPQGKKVIALTVDRTTLAKRRWRAVADDGREFGFDLDRAVGPGDVIYSDEAVDYVISQSPESVLELALPDDLMKVAAVCWQIGNLHFPVEVTNRTLRTIDDPAVRQMFDREHLTYDVTCAVFRPITAGGHGHHHD